MPRMVTKRRFELATAPQSMGRLVESCFTLWAASWRTCFGASLLYGIATWLPTLTLAPLEPVLRNAVLGLGFDQWLRWLPRAPGLDPADLFDALCAWAIAPRTLILFGLALLGSLGALCLVIHRQARVAGGEHPARPQALKATSLGIGASLIYLLILGLLTLPLLGLTGFVASMLGSVDLLGLLGWLAVFVGGSALLSVPLAWASVAYGLSPLAAVIDANGALTAQRHSARRVRGHWTHSAVVLTLPMLMYLGLSGALSSGALLLCGSLAYAFGGWGALFDLGWMNWATALAFLPMAAALPLATAGGVLLWHDLGLRRSGTT